MKTPALFILFLLSLTVQAQLKISGVVLDENKKSLPFVNIHVKGTTTGVTSNDLGEFEFITFKKRGEIEISFMGFQTQTVPFSTKKTNFTIYLKEESNQLDEVVIVNKPKKRLRKKENPAYRILKEVWKHKKKNGLQLVEAYQYKKAQTVEIGLNNLDTVFLKSIFGNDTKQLLERLPFDYDKKNYYVPLYISENVSTVFGNNRISLIREDTEAEKSNGVYKDGFVFERMANTFNEIDIYKNAIEILKRTFVSPISTNGFDTYDYILHDSITVANKKYYSIYFFPRRNGDLAFEGNLLIADTSFSVAKIKMTINKDINLNFVRGLSFEKEYIIKEDSIYLPKKNSYEGDFILTDKDETNKGLSIKKVVEFSDYQFDKVLPTDFYSEEVVQYKAKQFDKPISYWDSISSSTQSKPINLLIDEIKSKQKVQSIAGLLNALSTGYITVAPGFQIGQYWNAFTKNSVEGLKTKIGFRSYNSNDDRFRLAGFVAYGAKDKRFKWGLNAKYLLTNKPRIIVAVDHLYDVEQLGAKLLNTDGLNANVFDPNALFSRGDNYFLSFVNKTSFQFDIELKKNLHIGVSATHNTIKSASPANFSIDYINSEGKIETQITDVSTDVYIAYTPGRFEYGFGVERKMGRHPYPSMVLNYHRGYKGIFNGSTNYDKIQFRYSQPLLLGKIGILETTLDAGKTFGTVPIALLSPIPANQTYWLTANTFSLINYYDFVTDSYVSGNFEQHFNGFIMNRLPLIQLLKLRSILTFKTVYGTISNENRAINRSNITYAAPTDKMYYEYGFGFENIGYKDIRPLRIDFLWRGDHTSINGLPSPKFAVRVGIKAGF